MGLCGAGELLFVRRSIAPQRPLTTPVFVNRKRLILTLSEPTCLLTKDWPMRNTGAVMHTPVLLIGLHRRESSSAVISHARSCRTSVCLEARCDWGFAARTSDCHQDHENRQKTPNPAHRSH